MWQVWQLLYREEILWVSNIVVTRKGAQPSIPSFEELEEAPE